MVSGKNSQNLISVFRKNKSLTIRMNQLAINCPRNQTLNISLKKPENSKKLGTMLFRIFDRDNVLSLERKYIFCHKSVIPHYRVKFIEMVGQQYRVDLFYREKHISCNLLVDLDLEDDRLLKSKMKVRLQPSQLTLRDYSKYLYLVLSEDYLLLGGIDNPFI